MMAALLAATAHGQPHDVSHQEELVLGCALASTLVAARFAPSSPAKAVLAERATAYTRLAQETFHVTDAAIAAGLRALNSKVNTGVTAWSDVVTFAEQCPAVPAA